MMRKAWGLKAELFCASNAPQTKKTPYCRVVSDTTMEEGFRSMSAVLQPKIGDNALFNTRTEALTAIKAFKGC